MNLRRSILITFLSSNFATIVQFGVTLVLARLLTPAEVGIFSITVVFINIIAVFRDFGVSSYLQQEKDLTPAKASAAFGLLLTTSWSLAAATYFGRHYLSDYYNEPGIASAMAVLCISYALVPFAAFYSAVICRNMQAGKQAYVNVISTLAYAATCISLAYYGFSYMAMAWANVVNIAVSIAIYLIVRPKEYTAWPIFKGWKSPIKYGSGAIAGNLINTVNNSLPDLVLGKVSGAHDVGLYSRANGLVGIFNQIAWPTITYNSIPYIAKNYHDNVPLSPILAKATSYLTVVAWPAFIVTAIYAEKIIRVLYGEQWVAAAPIVMLIAFQAIVRFGYALNQQALLAIGRPFLSVFSAGSSIVFRLAILLALGANDLMSFAIALCIADVITVIVPAYLMSKYMGYSLRTSLAAHYPSIKVGLVCLASILLLKYILPNSWPDLLQLTLVSGATVFTWLVCVIKLNHPISNEFPQKLLRVLKVR